MNIERARTEPFFQFHRFHEAVSRDMRIIVASLAEFRKQAEKNQTAGVLTQLTPDGEPWSPQSWKNPSRPILAAKRFVAQMGIVQVITALEDFCSSVKAEHDRYGGLVGSSAIPIKEDQDSEGISPRKLYNAVGWSTAVLEKLEPAYDYFSMVRNCIVHRSGRASRGLIKIAGSPDLQECLSAWHGKNSKKVVPALPAVALHEDVAIFPRHVILASETCRRIAQDANSNLLTFLGAEGVVYMAAHHSLFSKQPVKTDGRNSPEAMLNSILASRYQAVPAFRSESSRLLRKLNKWEDYKLLFRNRIGPAVP